jgi:hypothetical protein
MDTIFMVGAIGSFLFVCLTLYIYMTHKNALKTKVIFLLLASLVGISVLVWVYYFILPNLAVSWLGSDAVGLKPGDWAYGHYTNGQIQEARVIKYTATGWKALFEVWPITLGVGVISGSMGWIIGKKRQKDTFAADTELKLRTMAFRVMQIDRQLKENQEKLRKQEPNFRMQIEKIQRLAREQEHAAANLVKNADSKTAAAEAKIIEMKEALENGPEKKK